MERTDFTYPIPLDFSKQRKTKKVCFKNILMSPRRVGLVHRFVNNDDSLVLTAGFKYLSKYRSG